MGNAENVAQRVENDRQAVFELGQESLTLLLNNKGDHRHAEKRQQDQAPSS